jgi:hypothetical protein
MKSKPIELSRYEAEREVEVAAPIVTVKVTGCLGCGGYHGGTTDEVNCLRKALAASRTEAGGLLVQVVAAWTAIPRDPNPSSEDPPAIEEKPMRYDDIHETFREYLATH